MIKMLSFQIIHKMPLHDNKAIYTSAYDSISFKAHPQTSLGINLAIHLHVTPPTFQIVETDSIQRNLCNESQKIKPGEPNGHSSGTLQYQVQTRNEL